MPMFLEIDSIYERVLLTRKDKMLLINVILSQQYGYGYFDNGVLNPYDHIHCYLNIPDTSGRDSLFQAEARRCKNIIDTIETHANEKHFCIFEMHNCMILS